MGLVNIEDLKPGMITAEPVINNEGVVLKPGGQEVSEKSIRIFKMWGIAEINIQNVESDDSTDLHDVTHDPEFLRSIQNDTRFRFRHTNPKQRVNRIMYKLSVQRLLKEKSMETADVE